MSLHSRSTGPSPAAPTPTAPRLPSRSRAALACLIALTVAPACVTRGGVTPAAPTSPAQAELAAAHAAEHRSTAASRAAAGQFREAARGLASRDVAVRRRAAISLDALVHDHRVWHQARIELRDAEREATVGGLAPFLASEDAGERERTLRTMHKVMEWSEAQAPPSAAPWAAGYAQRLLDRRGLSAFEADNRGMQLAMALDMIRTPAPDAATRSAVRRAASDRELEAAVVAKQDLGWASAQGALQAAQDLEAGWAAATGAAAAGVAR